jgi:hypothetical protein
MAVKYVCCQCDIDMTNAVKKECSAPSVHAPTLVFKGMDFVHAARSVTATCPNGHTCDYPCIGAAHE